ncbi:MAG: DUF6062 family protein [Chloroflexi bacterium]|nr:DUF6062 family protein [Chloroflexota bacterium]
MTEKDVLYFELLEAFQAGGCPLCRLGQHASDSYLDALIYEGVTDVRTRAELRDARGPCHRHAWRMAHKRGSVLGTAIIYRDVVNTLTRTLEESAPAAPSRLFGNRGGNLGKRLAATIPCPACRLEEAAEERTAKTLLKHLGQEEIGAAYVAAGGLCLPHFQLVLGHASESATRRLAGWQATALRKLRDELDELIRKHDHRFAREPITEAEGDSWQRTVAAVVGRDEAST